MTPRWMCLLALAACGDDGSSTRPDGAIADAALDAPATGCDYTEQRDSTNDDVPPASGTPEPTNITLAQRAVVCGVFDHTHFDGDITVDVDGYVLALATEADVLVRIHGTGLDTIELVGVDIYGGASFDQLVGKITLYGAHGVTALRLPAGSYELAAFALASEAITSSVPYRLDISVDTPATRCEDLTSGGYTEANDGQNNDGNDVIRLASGMAPMLTASQTDAPEPTGLVVSPTNSRLFTGAAADIASPDLYEDKDTYEFATSPMTNELTVRLRWDGTTTNLDFVLFEAGSAEPVTRGNSTAMQGPEVATYAIKPDANYWLLVGARAGTTVPNAYAVTLCGANFRP